MDFSEHNNLLVTNLTKSVIIIQHQNALRFEQIGRFWRTDPVKSLFKRFAHWSTGHESSVSAGRHVF